MPSDANCRIPLRDMAGIPLFAQGGDEKLTSKKAARAAQNLAQTPFFALKPRFCAKKRFWGYKRPQLFFFAHAGEKKRCRTQKSKTEAGQIGMKTGECPPCFAIAHWPYALTKVLPAQVARAARSASRPTVDPPVLSRRIRHKFPDFNSPL